MFKRTTALNKVLKLKKRVRVVPGGTWAGKTFDILCVEIDYLIKNPNTQTSVVSETIPSVKKGALKDFKNIMQITGRWFSDRYNATDRMYTFSNGSSIEFTAFDSEDKAKQAGKRNRLFLNEVNTISKAVCDALMIRTDGVIWMDYNPTARFWVNEELENHKQADWLTLTYRDNEALPDTILKELEARRNKAKTSSYWENWCNVYLDGKIGSLEGVCITSWNTIDSLPEEARLLCYGMDFGYSLDPTTLVGLYKWNESYIFDEMLYKKGMLNSDISNFLKSSNVTDWIYADSAEPKSIQELKVRGHKVEPCSKGADSIVYGIELLNQNDIKITGRSTNLINELQNYSWKKNKEGEYIAKPIDNFNHAIDAMRYAITEELKNPNKGTYYIY